ncbi:hypothetical protein [Streptomyces graminilatus]|uniref:hypothetical protein n=1 Tax=Streptomyces graminilatus TaxID=1464070 RepID=UPI001F515B18|nr:hypothetical protein [Streptomyces graminilatus]
MFPRPFVRDRVDVSGPPRLVRGQAGVPGREQRPQDAVEDGYGQHAETDVAGSEGRRYRRAVPAQDLVGGAEEGVEGRQRLAQEALNIGLQPGSAAGAATVQSLAYALINDTIRPFTTTWHPRLATHEAGRPPAVAPLDHEASWPQAPEMRAELTALREPLVRIAAGFGGISGADFGVPATG